MVPDQELMRVPIHQITNNPFQPRREFGHEELEELSKSIQEVGLLHPPAVRRLPGLDLYELISGERRLRACQLAGLTQIPVVVHGVCRDQSALAALVENVQRVDLNPMDVAVALQALIQKFGLSQEQVATRIGKKRSTVANYLRLLTLPQSIQEGVSQGKLSMGHAKVVLSMSGIERQIRLYEACLHHEWTVRELELQADSLRSQMDLSGRPGRKRDVHLQAVEQMLESKLSTRVQLMGTQERGRLCISYHSLEDLNQLLERLQVSF